MNKIKQALSADDIAMRESEAYLRTQDPVDVAATQWHTLCEQGLDAADEARFRQWLTADPAHQAAFAALDQSLNLLRSLPPERTAHLRRARPKPAAPSAEASRQGFGARLAAALSVRTTAVAFCCVALLAVGIGWRQWLPQPSFEQTYTAERGQRRDIALPDGSQLTLDTDTSMEVTLYRDRRLVRLARGQAMFSVARDASRPFTVLAGPARVTVLGTRFAVRCGNCEGAAAEVNVEVEEGHVGVALAGLEDDPAAELRVGQAIRVSSADGLGAVSAISPGGIAPWRKGLIRFASTPLAEALREFERYGPAKLLIRDPEVALMPIGGSYLAGNPAAFAQALPHILPVRLVRRADGMTEVVRKN
jgi:transmembrane sensor